MIHSPLNYTGGKFKLLPQILPLFPRDTDVFVDLFCGGCNVGLNAESRHVVYNDRNENLISLYRAFQAMGQESVLKRVYAIIETYDLSLVSRHGYGYYGCDSSKGLAAHNRDRYLKLRADWNEKHARGELDDDYYVMLYVLIVYAFNNQIRFNKSGDFNLPVGKRDFNRNMERKLAEFLDRIRWQDCAFTCLDFREFDVGALTPRDFVYADPPYLITCATYNEQGRWNEGLERDLLAFLDDLHDRQIRFALSNVLRSKGKENRILLEWLRENAGRYRAVPLSYSYSNSNYQTKDRSSVPEEVLIINYG